MRRLRVLISHLPQDSSLARSMGWWWTDALELQAQLVEIGYVTAQAGGTTAAGLTGRRFRPEPFAIPRPHRPTPAAVEERPRQPFTRQSIRDALLPRGR